MYKNYLVMAWKVLLRRKMFTFISLFGISLTLAVLLIASTLFDNYIYPNGPEKRAANFVNISGVVLLSKKRNSVQNGALGFHFLANNVARLKTPEIMSWYTRNSEVSSFIDNDRLQNLMRRTDDKYWQILDFDFIEGRYYTAQEFASGAMVMVISESTKVEFFGKQSALGNKITVANQTFQVIGVVKDVYELEHYAHSDMWVPYTTFADTNYKQHILGDWNALLYHSNTAKIPAMQSEYLDLLASDFVSVDPVKFATAYSAADTKFIAFSRQISSDDDYRTQSTTIGSALLLLAFAFMVLPSINLININVSRIMERSSEIGVRKSFGATSKQLVIQFLMENILLTAVGAVIGLAISTLILWQLELSQALPGADFQYTWHTVLYGMVMILIFGLLSGVYPAYKMSKLDPVTALKGGA